eukprot:scaffold830_cov377-Prasinococcus_capsulatus_cf.AAC.2
MGTIARTSATPFAHDAAVVLTRPVQCPSQSGTGSRARHLGEAVTPQDAGQLLMLARTRRVV